jgi:hypothetical protein
MIAECTEHALRFESMAAREENTKTKAEFEKQAESGTAHDAGTLPDLVLFRTENYWVSAMGDEDERVRGSRFFRHGARGDTNDAHMAKLDSRRHP